MLETSIYFLAHNDLYGEQKPYSLRYEPKQVFLHSNMEMEKHEGMLIEDVRGREKEFDFCTNGFAVMPLSSQMTCEDFNDKEKLVNIYLKEVANSLREFLHASRVQIFEHTVSIMLHDVF